MTVVVDAAAAAVVVVAAVVAVLVEPLVSCSSVASLSQWVLFL